MNIDHLRLFVRVAATRNISQAGKEMDLSAPVASMHISKLEESIGARLIHRTTRKVSLTEEGEALLPYAEEIIHSVDAARATVGTGKAQPKGTLRVTAPASFGRMHLIPALNGFLDQYPDLSIDIRLTDSMVDLVEGGFDVAIRNADLKDSSLIAKKLASDQRIMCASPDYLAQYGEPKSPNDLKNHLCINQAGLDGWTFDTPDGALHIKPKGKIRIDHGEAVRDAAADGMGIAKCATWIAYQHLNNGSLVRVLQDTPLIDNAAIWAVYPSSRLLAPKVRAFIDYFAQYYGTPPYWDC
ncbi:LysR family transcriptional regulator [Photobacterium jeanii]|uniref:LysR family transcriptional regulator n=1 Tax=Photobacterium jeanii TaxID=858640 RepID=A0A178K6N4_9GAMM|nr:LysR family transcriptional regulator [Photobacterium jeanii]OAN12999.1 LysR family transcriptional regulator [Photobacterium jeanii]PST89147.1 LysR family transcriptional regulator [Photobacterium jeanii]